MSKDTIGEWIRADDEMYEQDDAVYFKEFVNGNWTGRTKTIYKNAKWEAGSTVVIIGESPQWISLN